ncbi:MAG TPA: DUF349 domain-containing protein [Actinomycetales bacterium]|nr:DUF349 domain-containing protein [Actinomycetales bacterium]
MHESSEAESTQEQPTLPVEPSPAAEPAVAAEAPEPPATEPTPSAEPTAEPTPSAEPTAAEPAADVEKPRVAVPSPAALANRPGPRPSARPRPATGAAPAGAESAAEAAVVPVAPPVATEELIARAREWGRVAEDGTVFVKTAEGERAVGSYPGASDDEALAYFARKYDELAAQLTLAEQRLSVPDAPVKDVARALDALRPQLEEPNAVGDLPALQQRTSALDELVAVRRKEAEQRRAEAKEAARQARTALVEESEQIAETDPSRMQWKPAGDRLRVLFDEWRTAQRSGTRLDKPVEDELWKRFSHARTVFDRKRRQHFSELEKRHNEVKAVKQKLVAEAETLSESTDWGATSAAYRQLMDRWKAAGRAARKDDDALWARFRAAQDKFFAARNAANAKVDEEFRGNLEVKEKLLAEAEALLPVKDLEATKAKLRDIQERWEAAGKVPRADVTRVEKRLRAVEQAVRKSEEDKWRRTNPEARARAEGALGQLEESIAGLERDLETARSRGDERRVREAEEALAARRAWLEQVRQAANDFS